MFATAGTQSPSYAQAQVLPLHLKSSSLILIILINYNNLNNSINNHHDHNMFKSSKPNVTVNMKNWK